LNNSDPKMEDNGENYTCGNLLVMAYVKSAKDGPNLKKNSPLWRVFCAWVPCGNSEVIFCPQPGVLNCMEESRGIWRKKFQGTAGERV